jgi:hypothetical protein
VTRRDATWRDATWHDAAYLKDVYLHHLERQPDPEQPHEGQNQLDKVAVPVLLEDARPAAVGLVRERFIQHNERSHLHLPTHLVNRSRLQFPFCFVLLISVRRSDGGWEKREKLDVCKRFCNVCEYTSMYIPCRCPEKVQPKLHVQQAARASAVPERMRHGVSGTSR